MRLLAWFLAALVLAGVAAGAAVAVTRDSESTDPARAISRHVQHRLARTWNDERATDAYVAELRESLGLDVRLRRDVSDLPLAARPRAATVFVQDGVTYIPIVRDGRLVGALSIAGVGASPSPLRIAAAALAALLAMSWLARRVAHRIAAPLEQVAHAAERFGAGDLSARTRIDCAPARWVDDEVREVGRSFDTMAGRIEHMVDDQRALLAALSHELRSPLARARVALALAHEKDGAARERALETIGRNLGDVDQLLTDLLASARVGLSDLRREPTDLEPWLRAQIASELEHAPGPVELHCGDEARTRASVDQALLGRALHNLLVNAWDHGHPAATPLEVELSHAGESVSLRVRDRGPGFPEDMLDRAFEPFVRSGDGARTPDREGAAAGTRGLGLALVRRIAEAHGGRAHARNVRSGDRVVGAIVTLELPKLP